METESVSFGTWLRRQREIREIPLREIAEVTKISVRYLEALEQDRFDVLPAPVFAKGFLREYSRYVGIDPDEVVNSYLIAQQSPSEEVAPELPRRAEIRGGRDWITGTTLAVGVTVLVGVVAFLVFWADRSRARAQRELPPIAAPPIVVTPAAPKPEPAPVQTVPLLVTMDFTEDCWVEATVDGERRISELHVQGESMRLEAAERVILTLGNPSGVHIEANGKVLRPQLARGRVLRDLVIDLDTLEELAKGPE